MISVSAEEYYSTSSLPRHWVLPLGRELGLSASWS